MKAIKFIPVLLLAFLFSATVNAQSKTDTVKVWGNCGMCEKKIETAALATGASAASWDSESKMLTITYNKRKNSTEKVQKAIAAVGYDTRDYTGDDEAYKNLPGCCQYGRKAAVAKKD